MPEKWKTSASSVVLSFSRGAVPHAPLERSGFGNVKLTVNRSKAILALLLPVLWLSAPANGLLDAVNGCASNRLTSSVSAGGNAKRNPTNPICSFVRAARRWSRRLNDQSGPVGAPAPLAISQLQHPPPEHIEAFSVGSRSSFGLANCWQFRWRTALEPRAPSSVS
jgi:hypothetical protein